MEWTCAACAPVCDEKTLTCFIVERGQGALYAAGWAEVYPELKTPADDVSDSLSEKRAPETVAPKGEKEAYGYAKRALAARAFMYGTTWKKYLSPREAIKTACADALRTACALKLTKVRLILDEVSDLGCIRDLARAAGIAAWSFDAYHEKKEKAWDALTVAFVLREDAAAQAEEALRQAFDLARSINLARGLINEPGNVLTPPVFASRAEQAAGECGLSCIVLNRAGLTAGEYNGILSVGQGSMYEPRMVVIQYRPSEDAPRSKKKTKETPKHIALVGKGITFDTGGVSLKPGKDMHAMKNDMSGAAVVLGVMRSVAKLKPACMVSGILVCAENHFGSAAQRPGDIFKHKSGKYVQVDNTDAEGRLCLIDGLYRAGEEGADTIIDIATLTGACMRALGTSVAGIFGNDDALVRALQEAGHKTGEELWPFPLVEEYARELETPHADIRNIGGAYAGHIVAALFLRKFVPAKARWAHIDLCPAYFENGWKYYAPGGTAFGIQLLVDWIISLPKGN